MLFLLALVVLSACGRIAPPATPAQLDHTPGAPVVITEEVYTSEVFSVRYPPGWEVITSPGFSAPWVVFISPDEQALMVLALDADDTQVNPPNAEPDLRREERVIPLGDDETGTGAVTLTAVLVAPAGLWDEYMPLFERVTASVMRADQP